jgi:solute carrier family 25 iron transporter 28/37
LRAFREDESRRNAPLTPENATRVMEAMRGVSLGSFVPDWAGGVGGEQWIDELRRLRQPPGAGNQPSFQN